jgi:N-acetylmuramoyl-L-alanine amidase
MYNTRMTSWFFNIVLAGLLWTGWNTSLWAQGPQPVLESSVPLPDTWLTVVPKANETGAVLLQRYALSGYPCNVDQFCKINKIKEKDRLKTGATYKLPIVVQVYNGKSIRSTLGIEDWKVAKRIEEFNRKALETGLRADNFIVSKKLWTPWHEYYCPEGTAAEPPLVVTDKNAAPAGEPETGKKGRIFPIFGKAYEKTPLLSSKLKGRVFYIVSGHGGPDVGAQGTRAGHTLCEDEYAYDVSLRLLRLLVSHGATAYMIVRDANDGIRDVDYLSCDKDETVLGNLVIPYGQKERLTQRSDLINELTERNHRAGLSHQTFIEIHVDSRSVHQKTDVFFYYRPESERSKALALKFHRTFLNKYQRLRGQRGYNGTVTPRYLHMLKETVCPRAVYIELGNIKNEWDQQRLVLKNNRQAVAKWLSEVLLAE